MGFEDDINDIEREVEAKRTHDTAFFGFGETPEQRTDEWFENRRGRFTGSKIKDLMGCDRSVSKMQWGVAQKIINPNKTALKYIYGRARERMTGKVIRQNIGIAGKHGTNAENLIIERFLEKTNGRYEFQELGFIPINAYLGASPDGGLLDTLENKKLTCEMKMATEWGTEFERVELPVEQSATDFWQVQTEMMAHQADGIVYIVGEPDVLLDGNPVVDDVHWKIVERSPIHQQAILQRAALGNAIIEKFMEYGVGEGNFYRAVSEIIQNWEI